MSSGRDTDPQIAPDYCPLDESTRYMQSISHDCMIAASMCGFLALLSHVGAFPCCQLVSLFLLRATENESNLCHVHPGVNNNSNY